MIRRRTLGDIVDILIELQTLFGRRVANDLDRPRVSRDTLSSYSLDGWKSNAIHTHAHVHKIHEKRGHTRTRRTSEHDTTDNTRGRTKMGNDAFCGERIYDRGSTGRKREENEKNIYKRINKICIYIYINIYIYISIYFYLL